MLDKVLDLNNDADCLWDKTQIAAAYDQLASDISRDMAELRPVILCVMNGGLFPTAEILQRVEFLHELEYVHATRYRGELSGGQIDWLRRPPEMIRDRHVLIIDDLLDEGPTLKEIQRRCREMGAASVRTAALAEKHHDRRVDGVELDYVALSLEDRYVFGCGMDYKGYYRNLPAIYALKDKT